MPESHRGVVQLGPLEHAVMNRLWDGSGGVDVAAMHLEVGVPRGLARNTIHSTLERLVRKGLVSRERRGRAYEYTAAVARTAWIAEILRTAIGALGPIDRAEVLAGFVEFAERTSESTLETLEELIRARSSDPDDRGET